ncbi:MAG: tRNA pseudouridine(13) synthase TruD [Planctomycetota bacterium]|nr:tRNA pseudouridine(13) synthase TruD [Planctomycetota bacterium]
MPVDLEHPAAVAHVENLGAGLGGRYRERAEDFVVEEIPLRRPSGRGDHAWIEIVKRGAPTLDVLLFLSKQAKVSERKIGYAGLKDSRAVARQYLTLPKIPSERLVGVQNRKFRVASVHRTDTAVKIGHLRGNRFTIRIRDADVSKLGRAQEVLERLVARGMPNAYGQQRFGTRQDGHVLGRAIVREDWQTFIDQLLGRPAPVEGNPLVIEARKAYDKGDLKEAGRLFPRRHRAEKKALGVLIRGGTPQGAFEAITPAQRKIWVSAWQSYLFNRVLDRRVREDTYDKLLDGDLAWLHKSGAFFTSADSEQDRALAASLRASGTGPLLGYDMRWPDGPGETIERGIADEEGADAEEFRQMHCRARGGRRPLRVPLYEASIAQESDTTVRVRFVLPPGAFATVALEHLMHGA